MDKRPAKLYVAQSSLGRGISGLFTIDFIKKGEYIIDYTGKYRGELLEDKYEYFISRVNEICDRQYSFEFDKDTVVDSIDVGNIVRFANHGHSKKDIKEPHLQNIAPRIIFNGTSSCAQFFATRDIVPNEELFFDYDYD